MQNSILANEEELTVLTRQTAICYDTLYGGVGEDASQFVKLYLYNNQGYMVRSESWLSNDHTGALELNGTDDWTYDNQTQKWTWYQHSKYRDASTELQEYRPGAHLGHTTGRDGNVCITTDPYPEGAPQRVYNSDYNNPHRDSPTDWYFAEYTYDEQGYAVFIESYNVDEVLLGTCELEWETIRLEN